MKKTIYSFFFIISLIGIVKLFSFYSDFNSDYQSFINHFNNKYSIFALPKPTSQVDFCAERVPLENPDIWERYDKELLKNTYWQSKNRPKPKDYGYFFVRVFPTVFDQKNTSKKFHPPTHWN